MVSSHNPFRTPEVTPTPTGASEAVPANAGSSSSIGDSDVEGRPPQIDPSVSDLLNEELPPAYTPAPNVYEGEATLELGPRRPFQQPIPIPPQQQSYGISQFPPPSWGMSPQPTGSSGWSAFPGQRRQELYTTPVPPPVHPDLAAIQRPSSTPNAPPEPLSDFARDFYTAGAGDSGLYGGSSSRYQSDEPDASSPSSSSRRYVPPPGEPPNHTGKSLPPTPTSPAQDGHPDDGRPTDRPVPGHPLLRHGKVLVYPAGFECQKCECCVISKRHDTCNQGRLLTNFTCQAATRGTETTIPHIHVRAAGTSMQSRILGPSHTRPGRSTAKRPRPPQLSSGLCPCSVHRKPRCTSLVRLGPALCPRTPASRAPRPPPASVRTTPGTPAHQLASYLSLAGYCLCRRTLTGWVVWVVGPCSRHPHGLRRVVGARSLRRQETP